MLYRYFFHIIDRQFNEEYDYIAHFTDHFEAADFIKENEDDGNTVLMIPPFYCKVPADEVDLDSMYPYEC